MAGNGNSWNDFMQTRTMRTAMYSICTVACLYYAVDGIMEMMNPERAAYLVQAVGSTGYYAITIARVVVCIVTGIVFGRMAAKAYTEDEDE